MYFDFENRILYSREDLKKIFLELKASGETDAKTFEEYLQIISPAENGVVESLYTVHKSDAVGKTYGEWICTNHGFDECIGFYRDGSEIWLIPDNIESFRILDIAANRYHCTAYIRFDVERE